MANKYNVENSSNILDAQSRYLHQKMLEAVRAAKTPAEVSAIIADMIKRLYMGAGRPMMIRRYAESDHLPFIEDYNDTMEEMVMDLTVLHEDIKQIGDSIADNFNYAQSEKARIEERIKAIGSLVGDLNLIANETTPNSKYFTESFNDYAGIEEAMIMGVPAQISTREGIATLARTGTANRSLTAKVKMLQGNGEYGTKHVAKQLGPNQSMDSKVMVNAMYVSMQTPNDQPIVMLDGRPDTIFEYQMVNLAESDKNRALWYDVDWAKGKRFGDKLRLKAVIELENVVDVNWLNVNPYNTANSTGKVTVYSIRTSEDGFDYKGLYEDGNYVISAQLNTTPQTYRADEVFTGSNDFNSSKFAGQGVWSFPTRKAKYVEIVFDQEEAYEETIGHTVYTRVTKTKDSRGNWVNPTSVRIREKDVPNDVVKGAFTEYALNDHESIVKNIETFKGWRYSIGIRDINVMSYTFANKSELISKKYIADKPIKEIMLYANEKIPAPFLKEVAKANDWIQYFISIDDVNWHQISLMHHQPVSDVFPPKIYTINEKETDLEAAFHLQKGYLTSEKPVQSVRLKVIMQRPNGVADTFSPILEDYAIRIVYQD